MFQNVKPDPCHGEKEDVRKCSLYSTEVCPKFGIPYTNKNFKKLICFKLLVKKKVLDGFQILNEYLSI